MTDRRPLFAILLIMVIAFLPPSFTDPPEPPVEVSDSTAVITDSLLPPAGTQSAIDSQGTAPGIATGDSAQPTSTLSAPLVEDTILVRSRLYEYGVSTLGGRIVSARFLNYSSMHPADTLSGGGRDTLSLLRPGSPLLEMRLATGRDTLAFSGFQFSTDSVTVESDSARQPAGDLLLVDQELDLVLHGTVRGRPVRLSYTFSPDDYHFGIAGRIDGLGINGGTLLVGLGNGFADTESNIAENHREAGVVTKRDGTDLTRFSSLDPLETEVLSGPFDWVAVKSKYFVAGFFSSDTVQNDDQSGLIGGVVARVSDTLPDKPVRARVALSLPVDAGGAFAGRLYLGPMEYDRLAAMGGDFGDVNPYGWPGFRTVIRPFAVGIRAVFVWMHESLALHYGMAIILFGIGIRIVLWPLNQKAMRSMTAMQAIQPEMQELQRKYKEDPPRLQSEMMKLYREHKVNPFGGCWPMLLPYPVLVAVFFVLQNTIELRGVSFLWMPDLSRADPLYIIPVVMVLSMFTLSKIGQMGIPPNPQAKMMLYVMPAVFGILFVNFASGLNLYYAVQNIASLPQQWMIMKERRKMMINRVPVSTGPLPETAAADARDLIFTPGADEPTGPPPRTQPPAPRPTADILSQLSRPRPQPAPAEPDAAPAFDAAERDALLDAVMQEILEDPDASFRSVAVLYQDFLVRCRIRRVPGEPLPLPAFRQRFAVARAGVDQTTAAGDAWQQALVLASALADELQGVFLVLAQAAVSGAPCPSDATLARAYGSHSAGRARRLLGYFEERGLIVLRTDLRGRRVAAFPELGCETAPGDPAAPDAALPVRTAAE